MRIGLDQSWMGTQRRWRAWLNGNLLDRWLKNERYYQLNLIGGDHKNAEYRIADDVKGRNRTSGRICDARWRQPARRSPAHAA